MFDLLLVVASVATGALGLRLMHGRWQASRVAACPACQSGAQQGGLVEQALVTVAAPPGRVAVMAIVGVDRLDELRQRIGYVLAGDAVRALAERIASVVPAATMGRIGRTTIDLALTVDEDAVSSSLEVLLATLEQPLEVAGQLLDLTLRIGFVELETDAADPAGAVERAIERAELALADARGARRKCVRFDPAGEQESGERRILMRDLRGAVGRGEMYLAYQPKFRSRTESIDAVEALLRWNHPTRGLVPPDMFIPLSEESGEIRAITEWVIERAIVDQRRLIDEGHRLTVHVNISARLLADRTFADYALATVAEAAGTIGFEITETAVIEDPDGALANLDAFVAAGVRISIDDYGSGLSSLAYLKRLPAHELKIDKLFVSGLTDSNRDPLLIRSTIDLAHALEMEVTAEGVDTATGMALLRVMGCDLIQGYLISHPVPYPKLVRFLDEHKAGAWRGIAPPISEALPWWQKRALP